ncbi:MAG: hypothetical protein EZS28_009393 [Streblomastix strix]|uniref:Uncharacterized protein n=1 Tax=Streblomastix strix TaxID=222440 RepID=A0A5J4WL82_9EUKA|nr:MAG: hypothetical protein EZS28_009393 [Streblomastix strix]
MVEPSYPSFLQDLIHQGDDSSQIFDVQVELLRRLGEHLIHYQLDEVDSEVLTEGMIDGVIAANAGARIYVAEIDETGKNRLEVLDDDGFDTNFASARIIETPISSRPQSPSGIQSRKNSPTNSKEKPSTNNTAALIASRVQLKNFDGED